MSTPQKGRIFISYRRTDSAGYAGRIYDRLASHFGEDAIFMDVDTIEAGLDFVTVLQNAVQSCDVLVALIGRQWLHILDETGKRRLDNPEDFVRIEIAAALDRNIRVIPVLVDGVSMPYSTELPDNLKLLARRNALQVDHHSFNADANRLISQLELALRAAEFSKAEKARIDREARERQIAEDRRKREDAEKAAREEAQRVALERARKERIALERKEEEERARKYALKDVRQQAAIKHIKNIFLDRRKLLFFIGSGLTVLFLLGYIFKYVLAPTTPSTPVEASVTLTLSSTVVTSTDLPSENPPMQTSLPEQEPTETILVPDLTNSLPTSTPVTKISEKDGMRMVYVPAGNFWMGRENGDDDEKPAHIVYLEAFWISQTEVTNAMYAACVDDGICIPPSSTRSISRDSYYGNSEFDDYPVVYVSWINANAYCEWSGNRLLTEAEWEKAASWDAKNQNKNLYPWGDSIDCSKANYLSKDGYCVGDTTAVGSYKSGQSPYVVYDMAGNVWEWVADWYDVYPGGDENASRFFGQSFRVMRGGSWAYADELARSSDRGWEAPSFTSASFGIRCARDVETP